MPKTKEKNEKAIEEKEKATKKKNAPAAEGGKSRKKKENKSAPEAKKKQPSKTPAKNTQSAAKKNPPQKSKEAKVSEKVIEAKPKKKKEKKEEDNRKLRVMMLGGLDEIGKNLAVLEYGDDMIVVDCGLGFPDDDMLGVDLVIPDFAYLRANADKLRGVFITHGHEDHIGGVPYLLREVCAPIYGTRLTLGIIENKLEEVKPEFAPSLHCVSAGDKIDAGCFSVEFIRVNHSIADSCCLAIRTPVGTVVHSGDFKIDFTSVDGETTDLPRLAQIGREGVTLLMCESTNVEHPGYTPSEKTVGNTLDGIFMKNKDKRLVIATFSSNVHRVQQIIDRSSQHGRRVAILGRSMKNIVEAALDLGYMSFPEGALIDITEIKKYNPEQLTIICTGSQGEPMSALSRMAFGEHPLVSLGASDLVVISAHPIPGNEKYVDRIINELLRRGVGVWRDPIESVHVSGHACREEIKLMHALTKPKYFMPIHGETRHLFSHRELALEMGMKSDHIFVSEVGRVLEIGRHDAGFTTTVPSGITLIDGSGIGDVGGVVLRDRKHLSEDGLIVAVSVVDSYSMNIISGPDIISRGFVYVRESEELMADIRTLAYDVLDDCLSRGMTEWAQMKNKMKEELLRFIYSQTGRKPMVLPVIMTV